MTGGCNSVNNIDLTDDIQLFLECAQALEGRFGLVVIVCFICGKKNEKLYDRLLSHKSYGKGKHNKEEFWKALGK